MHADYVEKGHNCHLETYRRVFKTQNIGFGEPASDQCSTCLDFDSHKSAITGDHDENMCEICRQQEIHLNKVKVARDLYTSDMQNDHVYSVDMQKVIIIPKLTTKEHVFVSRLVCFNETFAGSKSVKAEYAVLWHEGISGRKASDVASSYVKFLTTSEEDKPILWADNCSGQNKNWTLYTALVQVVNAEWGPSEITIKYLEAGHTYMGADSVHGNVGKKMKQHAEIITFNDLATLIDGAAKTYKVVRMSVDDFYKFSAENRLRNRKKEPIPLLCDIAEVKFVKGSKCMYIKKDLELDEYETVDFLKPRFKYLIIPDKHTTERGISQKKKDGILNTLSHVPAPKRKFYMDLRVNNSAEDLLTRAPTPLV